MNNLPTVTPDASFHDVIRLDEGQLRGHVDQVVRASVEQTLSGLLEAEALCGAAKYQRSLDRLGTRAGHYTRQLHTKAGDVTLKVPRLRTLPFETQIIEHYRRRESSVEEALIEMYLAGVSARRIEDITEALWGSRISPSTVSALSQKIYAHEDREAVLAKAEQVAVKLDGLKLSKAARLVREGATEILGSMAFPREHGR